MKDDIYSPGMKVFRTFNSPFTNTEGIFIQFDDVVYARDYNMINILKNGEECSKLINMDEVRGLNTEDLQEWYINRAYKEALSNFDIIGYEDVDVEKYLLFTKTLTDKEYDELPLLDDAILPFSNSLKLISEYDKKITGSIFVYTEKYSKRVEKFLTDNYSDRINYVYGEFKSVINENSLSSNSSYVISDIGIIKKLDELKILNYSSIMVAGNYAYNEYEIIDNYSDNPVKIFLFDAFKSIKGR